MVIRYCTSSVQSTINTHTHRSAAAERTTRYSRILQTIPRPDSLEDFFKSIEDSSSKGDFKVGLEARYNISAMAVMFQGNKFNNKHIIL